jgi:hypothetical protein
VTGKDHGSMNALCVGVLFCPFFYKKMDKHTGPRQDIIESLHVKLLTSKLSPKVQVLDNIALSYGYADLFFQR